MAALVELVESDEISELTALSKGLKRLVEDCDFIVPDTSFVVSNLSGTRVDRINRGLYAGKQGKINYFSLIEIYKDLSIVRGGNYLDEINLGEIHDGFDQNLFVSDIALDALTSLLLDGKIAVPSQANDELIRVYNACLKSTRIFKDIFGKIRANGYTSKMVSENRSEAYNFAEDRKAFFRKQYSDYIKDLIRNTMAGLEKLDIFTGLIKARECIVEDSGMFEDPNKRIIDGAMGLDGRVGIASCNAHFYEKIKEVARLRRSSGLKVPNVTLMFVMQDFRGYDIKTY